MSGVRKVVLVDGKNMVFRHHYTHMGLQSEDGNPTSVLFGFLTGVLSLAKRLPDTYFVFVWDGEGPTWRHALLSKIPAVEESGSTSERSKISASQVKSELRGAQTWLDRQMGGSLAFLQRRTAGPISEEKEVRFRSSLSKEEMKSADSSSETSKDPKEKPQGYKANRQEMWNSEEHKVAIAQIPELQRALHMLGFRQSKVPWLEGDDLVATIATELWRRKEMKEIIIHSSDKDFYQLMPRYRILKGLREGSAIWVLENDILQEYGVECGDEWIKFRALTGDPSDNIPRVFRGVGPKTAVRWMQAGLNPSLAEFQQHPAHVKNAFGIVQMGKKEIFVAQRWAEVARNYQLCRLVTDKEDQRLSGEVRALLQREVDTLDDEWLRRHPRKGWREEFTEWCTKYDMPTLWGRRDEFGKIP